MGLSPEWQQWRGDRSKDAPNHQPWASCSGEQLLSPSPISASKDPQCPYSRARIITVIIQQYLVSKSRHCTPGQGSIFPSFPIVQSFAPWMFGDTCAVTGPILLGVPSCLQVRRTEVGGLRMGRRVGVLAQLPNPVPRFSWMK